MTLEKRAFGANVLYVDKQDKLLFTHSEIKKARERYMKEVAKRATMS